MANEFPRAVVPVPVKSAWTSKINWAQLISGGAMVLAWLSGGKFNLSASEQAAIVVVIGVINNVVTWVLRTWFTAEVTPSSVKPAIPRP